MKKWRFVSNQNSTIVGINDAGIETFTADMHRSLVREIIQNSLDAKNPQVDEPVRVEFKMIALNRDKVPDVDNLQSIIQKCRNSNKDEMDAEKFFDNANNLISQPTINVLRISDYNTIGLEGSETCEKGDKLEQISKRKWFFE